MSKANTTRTARNAVAVFAVALLCAAAMAVVLVDNDSNPYAETIVKTGGSGAGTGGDGTGDDSADTTPVKYKVKVTVSNGTAAISNSYKTPVEVEVEKDKSQTFKVKAKDGYALPETINDDVKSTAGGINKVTYSPGKDLKSGEIKVEKVNAAINITVVCEKKIEVKIVPMVENVASSKYTKTLPEKFIPGDKVEGVFEPIPGYDRPASVMVVYKDKSDSTLIKDYSQSTGKFSFVIPSSYDLNQTVTVKGYYSNTEYLFTSSILGGDIADKTKIKPVYNNPLEFKITAGAHYDLPDPRDVQVTNGDSKSYTYDATTGIVTIAKVVGNVSVTAKANAETFTVTYYDSDKKTVLDLEPSRFSYGIGCTLPTNVVKTDYLFTGWVDAAGKPITAVDKAWEPAEGKEGNVNVYATFKDDLSKYDVGDYQMPYLIAAILSMVALIAVPVIVKVRK